MSQRIWIDAGHGGSDHGASANNLIESILNLTVAKYLREILDKEGYIVGMTRIDDAFVDLHTRCNVANAFGANIFVSIHHNASGGVGSEIIHSAFSQNSEKLANLIALEYKKNGRLLRYNDGTYSKKGSHGQDYYCVIRDTHMPAIISEYAFVDNTTDCQAINSDSKLFTEANAIANGIKQYFL